MAKSKKARRSSRRQVVRLFTENSAASVDKLGGKGFSLAEMMRLSVPVPSGFTVNTTVARAFMHEGRLPKRLARQVAFGISAVEKQTGRKFGDASNPLLVSVRSGAPVSMPGMMDTVLNLGLNPETVQGLARQSGDERFAWDCYARFLQMYGNIVCGIDRVTFSHWGGRHSVRGLKALCKQHRQVIAEHTGRPMVDDVWEQLSRATVAVLQSWNSQRARAYRKANQNANWTGTAVNVQAMVFGNAGTDSCTGVVFSRNVATGESGLYGEFLPNAQGEDVVSGTRTPLPIAEMAEWNAELYEQLDTVVQQLAQHLDAVVDVEFTVERDHLHILQVRKAQQAIAAEVTDLVHRVWEKKLSKDEACQAVPATKVRQLLRSTFDSDAFQQAVAEDYVASGLPASPGDVVGEVVESSEEAIRLSKHGRSVVLVRPETSPDDLEGMLAAAAIVTSTGGKTSHAAVVARGLNKPAVVGATCAGLYSGLTVSVSGTTGIVVEGKVPFAKASNRKETNIFLRWLDRHGGLTQPRIALEARQEKLPVCDCVNDFYLVDAMAAAATGELGAEAERLRQSVHHRLAELMAAYVVVATAGELRHGIDYPSVKNSEAYAELLADYGIKFHMPRPYSQESTAAILEFMTLEQQLRYLELAAAAFVKFGGNDSIGGQRWANIARSPIAWSTGEMNATVFVDHAFDLHHNCGRMFGKHQYLMTYNGGHGHEGVVKCQLDTKCRCKGGVTDLFNALLCCHAGMSAEVRELYERGRALKAW
ncbi:MAG: PEP/pyruvate-binding domain-containing protein [Patescibacteria group bacterium]|nr:PEP/pyruvate-binding domain-containing protein [Patescibacteria group bacterium]